MNEKQNFRVILEIKQKKYSLIFNNTMSIKKIWIDFQGRVTIDSDDITAQKSAVAKIMFDKKTRRLLT